MNTKENAPKDTKQAKKRIEVPNPEKSENTTLNKNYQSKNKNDNSTNENIYEKIFNDLIEKKSLLSKEIKDLEIRKFY